MFDVRIGRTLICTAKWESWLPIRISSTDKMLNWWPQRQTYNDFTQTREITRRLQRTPQILELRHQRWRVRNIRRSCVHFTLHSNKSTATNAVCAMLSELTDSQSYYPLLFSSPTQQELSSHYNSTELSCFLWLILTLSYSRLCTGVT